MELDIDVAELNQIRQEGMEVAASIWETLEALPEPIHPINIFKAACSIKCAEFMSRIRGNAAYGTIIKSLMTFLDGTLKVVATLKTKSNRDEGERVIAVLEETMPLTDEVFSNPIAYAKRQHTYDGIIMLAAAKMGVEAETKECISKFQEGVVKAVMLAQFAEKLTANE